MAKVEYFGRGANPNRRPSETEEIEGFAFTRSWCPKTGKPFEVFAVERGKPGQVNDVLMKASIVASMHMQGRSSDEIENNLNTIDSCQGSDPLF